jgi:hypothetical protein
MSEPNEERKIVWLRAIGMIAAVTALAWVVGLASGSNLLLSPWLLAMIAAIVAGAAFLPQIQKLLRNERFDTWLGGVGFGISLAGLATSFADNGFEMTDLIPVGVGVAIIAFISLRIARADRRMDK